MKVIKIFIYFNILFLTLNLSSMKYARIIDGHKNLINRVTQIRESTEHEKLKNQLSNPIVLQYLSMNPPQVGIVYYCFIDGRGCCFHESWLKELNEEEGKAEYEKDPQNETVVAKKGSTIIGGPKWFVDYVLENKGEKP